MRGKGSLKCWPAVEPMFPGDHPLLQSLKCGLQRLLHYDAMSHAAHIVFRSCRDPDSAHRPRRFETRSPRRRSDKRKRTTKLWHKRAPAVDVELVATSNDAQFQDASMRAWFSVQVIDETHVVGKALPKVANRPLCGLK
jgi:hypothetical protein